jgi:hypothetical protein
MDKDDDDDDDDDDDVTLYSNRLHAPVLTFYLDMAENYGIFRAFRRILTLTLEQQ